jgi:hypothetical protein
MQAWYAAAILLDKRLPFCDKCSRMLSNTQKRMPVGVSNANHSNCIARSASTSYPGSLLGTRVSAYEELNRGNYNHTTKSVDLWARKTQQLVCAIKCEYGHGTCVAQNVTNTCIYEKNTPTKTRYSYTCTAKIWHRYSFRWFVWKCVGICLRGKTVQEITW